MARIDYPRVLFLTPCAFNSQTGGGVTFANLFRGWPKDRLATVTDDRVPVSRDVCDQYYFLSDAELRYAAPLGWLKKRTGGAAQATSGNAGWKELARKTARLTVKTLLGDIVPDRGTLSARLDDWLQAYRPQVIYTILGSHAYLELLELLAATYRLPYVIHVMDHGTIDPPNHGLLRLASKPWYARRVRRIVAGARTCLAIGSSMADEYGRRFGRPFQSFQNTIDVERWSNYQKDDTECAWPARLMYVGALFPNAVLQSLIDCCQAVRQLNEEGLRVRLEVYTPRALFAEQLKRLPRHPSIQVSDVPATDDEFFALLQQADGLVLPVNFDRASVRFIRLSMPTKVPSYLSSGVPILTYGPPDVAQIQYARQGGWAHVVSERSLPRLKEGIQTLLHNQDLRATLSWRARQLAVQQHDVRVVRQEFQNALCASADQDNPSFIARWPDHVRHAV